MIMQPPPSQRRKLDVAPTAELPDQIIYSILLKLHVETLIKFCRLSKRWRETITNSTFAKQHMKSLRESASTAASCNVIYSVEARRDRNSHDFLSYRISSVEYGRQSIRPVKIPRFRFDGVVVKLSRYQTCDGLLCMLMIGHGNTPFIKIFNPATGKDRELTWPPSLHNMRHSYLLSYVGFGYELGIDDYKIVFVSDDSDKLRVQIMSLQENIWRTVDLNSTSPYMSDVRIGYDYNGVSLSSCVYMNGCVYWIVYQIEFQHRYVILKFNLSEERLSLLPLPSEGTGELDFTQKKLLIRMLVTLNGSLFFLLYEWSIGEALTDVDVWMLQEGITWSKFCTIPRLAYGPGHQLHPAGFNMSGHVIMVDTIDNSLIVYIPQENRFEKLLGSVDVGVDQETICFFFVDMETLISP